jgi:hypothetical protein
MTDLRTRMARLGGHEDASQGGEDAIILAICEELGITEGTFIEIGAKNGLYLSTVYRPCILKGWTGVLVEVDEKEHNECVVNMYPYKKVICHLGKVTLEEKSTVDDILDLHGIKDLDVFSIDIDSYDYWIWAGLKRQPKIVCIEYNGNQEVPKEISRAIPYDLKYKY